MRKIKIAAILLLMTTMVFQMENGYGQSWPQLKKMDNGKALIFVSAKNTSMMLTQIADAPFETLNQPNERQVCIFIDPAKTFQTMVGIGGALTDASAEVFAKLPPASQKDLLNAYYDKEKGIGYNFARTNIGSCDFSSDSYGYVADNDSLLATFNVDHDKKFKIPLIKQAITAAGGKLPLFVSPWSPPAWMKNNRELLHGGKLLKSCNQIWANHYVKFIKTYESLGIPVWGLSVQNEPMAVQKWESCVYSAEDERDFVKNYLGPTLQKNGLAGKKLIVWDHNRDLIYQRASVVLGDPGAAKYIWGVGFHWYETWTKSGMQFDNLRLVNWSLGEKYAHSMVNDFNCGTVAWTDWNILLDTKGGPNHVGNFCFAPVHADVATGKLIFTNSYFYIGHFSRFILPGAKRIACSSNRDQLESTAFLNPDGKLVVVVLNKTDEKFPIYLWIAGKAAQANSLPHSIMTVII
ncbi:MAG: glycoside hydrolase family 30 protein [Bacteroidia bacterium]|nr:glycoside hydrolase family 30 protein [Bacteroidia bacterium]